MESFAERLKREAERLGMGIDAIADALKMETSLVYRILRGKEPVIAEAFQPYALAALAVRMGERSPLEPHGVITESGKRFAERLMGAADIDDRFHFITSDRVCDALHVERFVLRLVADGVEVFTPEEQGRMLQAVRNQPVEAGKID